MQDIGKKSKTRERTGRFPKYKRPGEKASPKAALVGEARVQGNSTNSGLTPK